MNDYSYLVSKMSWDDERNSEYDYSSNSSMSSAIVVAEKSAWPKLLAKAVYDVDDYNTILNAVEGYRSLNWNHPAEIGGTFLEWLTISETDSQEDYEEYVFSSEYSKWAEEKANHLKICAWLKALHAAANSLLEPLEESSGDVDKVIQLIDPKNYSLVCTKDAIQAFADYVGMSTDEVEELIKKNHISKHANAHVLVEALLSAVPSTRAQIWDSIPEAEMASITAAFQEYSRVAEPINTYDPWDDYNGGSAITVSPFTRTENFVLVVNGENSQQYCYD